MFLSNACGVKRFKNQSHKPALHDLCIYCNFIVSIMMASLKRTNMNLKKYDTFHMANVSFQTIVAIIISVAIDAIAYKILLHLFYDLNKLRGGSPHDILIPNIVASIVVGYISIFGACFFLKKSNVYYVFVFYAILMFIGSIFEASSLDNFKHQIMGVIFIIAALLGRYFGGYMAKLTIEDREV